MAGWRLLRGMRPDPLQALAEGRQVLTLHDSPELMQPGRMTCNTVSTERRKLVRREAGARTRCLAQQQPCQHPPPPSPPPPGPCSRSGCILRDRNGWMDERMDGCMDGGREGGGDGW
eukprot:3231682-Rhodomonas_salina.1